MPRSQALGRDENPQAALQSAGATALALRIGIGINLVSQVLVSHLVQAERRFNSDHPGA